MPSYSLCALTAQCVHSTPTGSCRCTAENLNTLSPWKEDRWLHTGLLFHPHPAPREVFHYFGGVWMNATDLDLTHTPGPQKLVREGISVPAVRVYVLCFSNVFIHLNNIYYLTKTLNLFFK